MIKHDNIGHNMANNRIAEAVKFQDDKCKFVSQVINHQTKYDCDDIFYAWNGYKAFEVTEGYFNEIGKYENIMEASRAMTDFNQVIRIVNGKDFYVGNYSKRLKSTNAPGEYACYNIQSFEKVF